MKKILAAMSGGVDSAVAALLMKEAGADVTGVTLALNRTVSDDINDTRRVCARLKIPFYVFNFKEAFQREVVDRFIDTYKQGRTPNPCIDCNKHIKFGLLLQRAKETGFEGVVTGHYARVEFDAPSGRWLLKAGRDGEKDQSYMLYALSQEQLSHSQFPLGGLTKTEVRALAEENGLINAHKRDSQDICFVPDGDYAAFIQREAGGFPPGDFVGLKGEVYGTHKGIIHYTIGQRKGLGLSFPEPMYVTRIDPAENTVTLAPQEALFAKTVTARGINLIACESLPSPIRARVKLRYRHVPQPAWVEQTGPDTLTAVFDAPQRAPTPGQAMVVYDGDTVIGGGVIE